MSLERFRKDLSDAYKEHDDAQEALDGKLGRIRGLVAKVSSTHDREWTVRDGQLMSNLRQDYLVAASRNLENAGLAHDAKDFNNVPRIVIRREDLLSETFLEKLRDAAVEQRMENEKRAGKIKGAASEKRLRIQITAEVEEALTGGKGRSAG